MGAAGIAMRRPGDTRTALLKAALAVFTDMGYERATVASICAHSGMSNGSFYHFFKSKEALAATLYIDVLRSYHGDMIASVGSDTPAAQGVERLLEAHLCWVMRERLSATFLFAHSKPEWIAYVAAEIQASNAEYRSLLQDWIERRIADGTLRDLPIRVLLSQIIGPAQIFCRAWLSGREAESPDKYKAYLLDCAQRAVVVG